MFDFTMEEYYTKSNIIKIILNLCFLKLFKFDIKMEK